MPAPGCASVIDQPVTERGAMRRQGNYLRTSAFIRLVRSEPESRTLRREPAGRELAGRMLLSVEGRRAARRCCELAVKRARCPDRHYAGSLDQPVLDTAAELGGAEPRSLDAMHLATVASLGEDLGRQLPLRRSPRGHRAGSWHRGLTAPPRRHPPATEASPGSATRGV